MKKADAAVIGGTGLENMLKCMEQIYVGTPYGNLPYQFVTLTFGLWLFCPATTLTTRFLPTK
jgi:hypothetical protein